MDVTRTCNKCSHKFRDSSTLRRHQARLKPCTMDTSEKTDVDLTINKLNMDKAADQLQQVCGMRFKNITDLIKLQSCYRGRFGDEKMKQILQRGYIPKNAFSHAAAQGLLDAMTLLKEWGAPNFNGDEDNKHRYDDAFLSATRRSQIQAMELLKEWGANNFSEALKEAAAYDQEEAIKLLYIWGANNFDEAMSEAERRGNFGMMMFLTDLIASIEENY